MEKQEHQHQRLASQLSSLLSLASEAHIHGVRTVRATADLQFRLQSLTREDNRAKGTQTSNDAVPLERMPLERFDSSGVAAEDVEVRSTQSTKATKLLFLSDTENVGPLVMPSQRHSHVGPLLSDPLSQSSVGSEDLTEERSVTHERSARKIEKLQTLHSLRNHCAKSDKSDTVKTANAISKLVKESPESDQDREHSGFTLGSDSILHRQESLCDSQASSEYAGDELPSLEKLQRSGNLLEGVYAGFELRPVWLFDDSVAEMVNARSSMGRVTSAFAQLVGRSSVRHSTASRKSLDTLNSDLSRNRRSRLSCMIIHPSSPARALWDAMGICMICFDIFTLPLTAFEPDDSWFFTSMGWASQLFWNFDIFASFFTGFLQDGVPVMTCCGIAKHYLTTWFTFDVTIVATDWILYALVKSTEKSTASATRVSKMSRMLRFLRTIRVLKVFKINKAQDVLEEVFDIFASETAYTQLSIAKIMICILCINHFVACIWYAIGNSDEGWVSRYGVGDRELLYRYTCSYHWSVSQFGVGNVGIEAKSTAELIFSVLVALCALVLFSCLVSSATNALARYQQQRTDEMRQFGLFRRFCRQTGIPRQLTKRALNYLEYESREMQRHIDHNEVGLLNRLSEPLVAELMYWKYLPHLKTSILFHFLCRQFTMVMHKVSSEALSPKMGGRNDVMFHFGQQADEALYVMHGELEYKLRHEADCMMQVEVGQWIGEAALWTMWLYLGDLTAQTGCKLLIVNVAKFGEAICKNPEIWGAVVVYAVSFVDHLKTTRANLLTDVRHEGHVYPFEEALVKHTRHETRESRIRCLLNFWGKG